MPPPQLPPLPPGPLTLAAARQLGLSDHQWRLKGLRRQTQTVRTLTEPESAHERAALFALALPADCAFSHVTAAQLWGLPLPSAPEGQEDLDVIRATGRGRIERHGCIPHHGAERRELEVLGGLRVTGLADTWVDLGEVMARGLDTTDLVVAGDEVANRRPVAPLAEVLTRERSTAASGRAAATRTATACSPTRAGGSWRSSRRTSSTRRDGYRPSPASPEPSFSTSPRCGSHDQPVERRQHAQRAACGIRVLPVLDGARGDPQGCRVRRGCGSPAPSCGRGTRP